MQPESESITLLFKIFVQSLSGSRIKSRLPAMMYKSHPDPAKFATCLLPTHLSALHGAGTGVTESENEGSGLEQ